MDSSYAPRSPDLSGYAPQSPDLTSYRPKSPDSAPPPTDYAPQSPDLSGLQGYGAGQTASSVVNQTVPAYSLESNQFQQQQQQQQQQPPPPQQQQEQQQQQPMHWISHPQQQLQQQQQHQQHYSAQQQSYPPFNTEHSLQQPHPGQQYQDQYDYHLQSQQHSLPLHAPAYGSFSDSPTSMPAQTRTSNRTQQISYAAPPSPVDYDSYQTQQISPEPVSQLYQHDPSQSQPYQHAQLYAEDEHAQLQSTPARRGRKPKSESQGGSGGGGMNSKPVMKKMDTGGVEVKTKFPTARIKRIMQADEDVGKVAQVTPVVVAKALELFMIRLITSSATVAKSRGSKKVMSQHMKLAVMNDEQFDNLRDIVGKIPDAPPSKSAGVKDEDADDEEGGSGSGAGAATGKGKGRGKGKKRRDSDDF